MTALRDYLEKMAALRHTLGAGPQGPEEFVLEHGRLWTPCHRPAHVTKGTDHLCFQNALHLALDNDALTYVEGYASEFLPFPHAWCVDENGTVVDPTLDEPQAFAFYGVPFQTEFVFRIVQQKGFYGLLDDPAGGYVFLTGGFRKGDFLSPRWAVC